jgi:predicted DNA-binding transcriptional regulator YafY
MPANKNALIRYKVLDKCFRNPGKRYFIDDLILECESVLAEIDPTTNGISRKQIFNDIAFMESPEGWAIELERHKDGKRVYNRYSDVEFSINNMPINEVELVQLKSAYMTLSQFKGMPQFEWIEELLTKLRQGMLSTEMEAPVMEFEHNPFLRGIHHLGPLFNAIVYKKPLLISYQPFEYEHPTNVEIHPHYLKQYNSRWFLFGYNPKIGRHDWNLALDRIVDIKEDGVGFMENTVIDWQDYFDDMIGVTKPDGSNSEDVILVFTGKTGHYIESKPLHGSQKSKWLDPDTLEVRLRLLVNYELERLILSYADVVRVVEPVGLKDKIVKRLNDSVRRYNIC